MKTRVLAGILDWYSWSGGWSDRRAALVIPTKRGEPKHLEMDTLLEAFYGQEVVVTVDDKGITILKKED